MSQILSAYSYTKNLFVVYLKFKPTGHPVFCLGILKETNGVILGKNSREHNSLNAIVV